MDVLESSAITAAKRSYLDARDTGDTAAMAAALAMLQTARLVETDATLRGTPAAGRHVHLTPRDGLLCEPEG